MTTNRGIPPPECPNCEAGFEPCDIHDCLNCGTRLAANDAGWITCWSCYVAELEADQWDDEEAA